MTKKTYEVVSLTENISEALCRAIAKAAADAPGADLITNWELQTISGERGGIVGNRIVKVTIEAENP